MGHPAGYLLGHPQGRGVHLMCSRRTGGFTIIELSITILIVAIFFLLALPSFSTWTQNAQTRSATESILTGLQVARNEALRRDTYVTFTFGASADWTVSLANTGEVVQTNSTVNEANPANLTVTLTPAASNTVTFTGLGRVAPANIDGSAPLTQVDISSNQLTGAQSRNLRVLISGGQIKMCDPNVTSTTDPRFCA